MEIIGRVTKDAEVKTTKSEKQVVNFSVAINDSYKQKGASEVTKVVTYVDCSYWANPALAQYLTKDTLVELQGRISLNVYNDMKGEAKGSLRFHVNNIKLHGGNKTAAKPAEAPAPVIAGELTEPLDDLPF
ncbi:MAG: single-stranded DNA-binding protein [Bacteroidetes bacterium]|nr:single-stranded DNA-binding protein [Bacteroidota bacterium]